PAPAPETVSGPAPAHANPTIGYEKGVEVTVTSKDPATEIFLAHGDPPSGAFPDPYERIGLAPITIKLAAGTYSIETASPTQSTGHERFMVEQGKPLHIEIRAGEANVKGIGAVIAGLGVTAIVVGIVAIVSFSHNDSHYDRWGIGIPLVVGGAVGCGIGVGLTALGATRVDVQKQPQPTRTALVALPALTVRF
ncbi:MAG: hypothetical protein ACRENE_23085, partial [Polyangiaceae bacterium]